MAEAERREGTPVIGLAGVSKAYGAVQALDGVDMNIERAEVHCLAGENGAGKSTLIKILTGAIRRDSGEYRVEGREVGNPSPPKPAPSAWASSTRSLA